MILELCFNSGLQNFKSWAFSKTWYYLPLQALSLFSPLFLPKTVTKFNVLFIFLTQSNWIILIGYNKLDYWTTILTLMWVKNWWHAFFLHKVLTRKVTNTLINLSVGHYHCDLVLPSPHPEPGPQTSHTVELVTYSWKNGNHILILSSGEETALPKTICHAIFHFSYLQHDS